MNIQILVFFMSILFGAIVLIEVLPPRGVEQITVIELIELLKDRSKNNYQYIDVRTSKQFHRLHVFGFNNIPLHDLKKKANQLSKDKKVVVISERGIGGNEACKILKRRGFSNLANVRGGVVTWESHE
ncbi:MAG TPA: rhodanese-like domain-containing protein [Bacillota bacterium]|nr:rhodanese-like domain-containing protein [Bacillota bacterium]